MISNLESELWLVVYTERVLQLCEAVLMAIYAEYGLWYVTLDVISFA